MEIAPAEIVGHNLNDLKSGQSGLNNELCSLNGQSGYECEMCKKPDKPEICFCNKEGIILDEGLEDVSLVQVRPISIPIGTPNEIIPLSDLRVVPVHPQSQSKKCSANMVIATSNYTIWQPLDTHIKVKSILMDPDRISEPFVVQHTLRNNPKKHMKDWDVCDFARKLYCEPNAGGKSVNSEAFSANILNELYGITNILSEMEVQYMWYDYTKCDYVCTIYDQRVGVSVTRAMAFPDPSYFTIDDADRLLKKKINGLMVAREGIITKYDFKKCILHIWCESKGIADIVKQRYQLIDNETRDNIIIVLTVTTPNTSPFIYYDTDANEVRDRIISESSESSESSEIE